LEFVFELFISLCFIFLLHSSTFILVILFLVSILILIRHILV
jgi:hypothetical protein